MCIVRASTCACAGVSLHVSVWACKGLRVLAQANLSKQVFVIASGWMTFGASLESPVTSCGGDRGEAGKELTKKSRKTLAGWISVVFLIRCSWKGFAEHACSFSASPCFIFMHFTRSHLADAQYSHALLLYFILVCCSTGAKREWVPCSRAHCQ